MIRVIELTQGQIALVDEEDFERVSQRKWYAKWDKRKNNFYAVTNLRNDEGARKTVSMNNYIMQTPEGMKTDHIYGYATLDNRRANLRVCTSAENLQNTGKYNTNTSGFKGVSWHKSHKKWVAQIQVNNKKIHLGYFNSPEEAHAVYCRFALELHGTFCRFS